MARTLPSTQPCKRVLSLFRESFDFSLLEAEESWISLNFILTYSFFDCQGDFTHVLISIIHLRIP